MSTFVIVPDAGAAAARLRNAGHRVHTAPPTVEDVVTVLEEHDLRDVILVGHGAAGLALGAAAARVPDRVAQLVFLDASVASVRHAPRTRRTYVHCTAAVSAPRVRFGDPGWEVTDLPAGAAPFDETPDLVATLLEALADRAAR